MKYLKLFKESDKSDYYSIITCAEDYNEMKVISISTQSIEYLKNITPRYIHKIQSESSVGGVPLDYIQFFKNAPDLVRKIDKYGPLPPSPADFFIKELDDEYFYVFITSTRKMYRCDQLDGVKELLEDLNYI